MNKTARNEIYLDDFKFSNMPDFEVQDVAMRVLEERGYISYVRKEFE